MELDNFITNLTFIPWIIMYVFSILNNLSNKNYRKFSFTYLKKNIFKIFRVDTLFLIIVFWYFASFNKEFVDKYLFAVMCIYMFANSLYEKRNKRAKDFFKNNVIEIVLLTLVMGIPLLVYFINNDLILTYKMMLVWLFLEYIIILAVSYIASFIKKIVKLG